MKHKRARRAIASLIAIIVLFPCSFFVGSAHAAEKFDTKDFSVNIRINEDNSLQIKEQISVNFNQKSQGIFRTIPFKGTFKMKRDNELIEEKVRAEIYDVKVKGGEKKLSTEGSSKLIRIGTEGKYIEGPKKYTIEYKVRFFKDQRDDFDFIYLNVLPNEWASTIQKGKLRVEFPKDFDTSELRTYLGDEEMTKDFTKKDGDKLVWEATATNLYKTGVTIHAYLPEGYFVDVADISKKGFSPMILSLVMALISLALWFLFGRDEEDIEVVEFRSPDGMDPIAISYHLTGKPGPETIAPEIMYLGNKGFLEVEVDEENDTFYLEKTDKSYENEASYRRTLMNNLFSVGARVDLQERSDDYWLGLHSVEEVAKDVLEVEAGAKRETRSSKLSQAFMKFSLIVIIAVTALAVYMTPGAEEAMLAFPIIGGIAVLLGSGIWDSTFQRRDTHKKSKVKGLYILGGALLVGNVLALSLGSYIFWDSIFIGLIIGLAMLAVSFFHVIGGKATDQAHQTRGRILGFKNFLEQVEVDKMKELVDDDPNYFFDIMPYTFLFGFKDKWMSRFADVVNDAPPWLKQTGVEDGMTYYDSMASYTFYRAMDRQISNNIKEAVQAEIGESLSDSGGSSGGFGGGGFGGGGGGSW